MSLYSTLIERTIWPLVLRRENRHSALTHWRFLEKSQYWPRERLLEYQTDKLRQLLAHAYKHCPYYTRIMDERGLTPESFKSLDDLALLPVLTKDLVYDNNEGIVSTSYHRADLRNYATGGTTGQQMHLFIDNESYNIKLASEWRCGQWMGMSPCDKLAILWPAAMDFDESPKLRTRIKDRYIGRKLVIHIGAASQSQMHEFYKEINGFRPRFLKTFPAPMVEWLDYLKEKELPIPRVKAIMSTGEPLYDEMRAYMEQTFGCPVYDMYGSRELGHTASQCSERDGLHIAMETSIVEFLENGRPVRPGEQGEIFITDLTNYAFPMIRYAINDYGRAIEEPCVCGRGLARMSTGVGRVQDFFLDASGRRHAAIVLAVHTTSDLGHRIGQMQIIQRSLLDFLVRIARKPEPTQETFRFITERMKKMIGESINVQFEVVDRIPQERSGKTRFFICQVRPSSPSAQPRREAVDG
ncbi:MAG: AMP-binding protein [Candidatus Zixiibacteriota bacterium]